MSRQLTLLVGIIVILAACYMAASVWLTGERSAVPVAQQNAGPIGGGPAAARPAAVTTEDEKEQVAVTVTLPAEGDPLPAARSGHRPSCPQTQVSAILGVSITSPHGIVIGGVVPEGCAAKAGIQPGDSIVRAGGTAVTCPSKLLPHVERGAESRDIELTVRRDKASAETLPTEEPDQSRPNV